MSAIRKLFQIIVKLLILPIALAQSRLDLLVFLNKEVPFQKQELKKHFFPYPLKYF